MARLAGCFKAKLLVSQESPGQKREKLETGGAGVHVVVALIGGIILRVHWGAKGRPGKILESTFQKCETKGLKPLVRDFLRKAGWVHGTNCSWKERRSSPYILLLCDMYRPWSAIGVVGQGISRGLAAVGDHGEWRKWAEWS